MIDKATDSVVMGGDSAGVSNYDISVRKDSKVFYVGEFLVGCTTSFRMMQLLRFSVKPIEINKDIFEYMCTDFVNEIRKVFKEGGYAEIKDGKELGGQFLVAYKNRLFMIDADFQVSEHINGYDAVGCGYAYALGSIFSQKDKLPTRGIIYKALECAAYFSAGVCEPFNILSTEMIKKSENLIDNRVSVNIDTWMLFKKTFNFIVDDHKNFCLNHKICMSFDQNGTCFIHGDKKYIFQLESNINSNEAGYMRSDNIFYERWINSIK